MLFSWLPSWPISNCTMISKMHNIFWCCRSAVAVQETAPEQQTMSHTMSTSLRMWTIPILKIHRSATLVTSKPSTVTDKQLVLFFPKEACTSVQHARLPLEKGIPFCTITGSTMHYPAVTAVLIADKRLDKNATCFSIWIRIVMPEPTSVFVGSRSDTDLLLWNTTKHARLILIRRLRNHKWMLQP